MKHDEAIAILGNDPPNFADFETVGDFDNAVILYNRAKTYAIEHLKRFQWRPIEDAPRDGETVLVCLPRMMNLIIRARYCTIHKHWLSERESPDGICKYEFFHGGDLWMPLPDGPEKEGEI